MCAAQPAPCTGDDRDSAGKIDLNSFLPLKFVGSGTARHIAA